jgi:hypothetical protein
LGQLSYIHRTHIPEPKELNEATQYFTTLIQEAAWYLTPTPKEERKKINIIPLHIRELVTEKCRAEGGGFRGCKCFPDRKEIKVIK